MQHHFAIVLFFFVGKLERPMILGDQVYTWLRISSETVQAYVPSNYPVSLTQLQIKIGFEFSYIIYSATLLHNQPLIYESFFYIATLHVWWHHRFRFSSTGRWPRKPSSRDNLRFLLLRKQEILCQISPTDSLA